MECLFAVAKVNGMSGSLKGIVCSQYPNSIVHLVPTNGMYI